MAETLHTRVTRLENLVGVLADKQARLDDVLVTLAEAQIQTQQQIQEMNRETDRRFQETDRRFQETDRRFQETDRRSRELDERIDKLVSAIGELIRRERS